MFLHISVEREEVLMRNQERRKGEMSVHIFILSVCVSVSFANRDFIFSFFLMTAVIKDFHFQVSVSLI